MTSIYTDGSCTDHHKKGKRDSYIGVFIPDIDFNFVSKVGANTNVEAEMLAILTGLKLAQKYNLKNPEIYNDNLVVIQICQGVYKARKKELKKIINIIKQYPAIYKWIPRELNKAADCLSKQRNITVTMNLEA